MFERIKNVAARMVIVVVASLLASSAAFAGDVSPNSQAMTSSAVSDHFAPILPYRGIYYTPGHGGTGLTLDVDVNGYVFAVFYTYDKAGQPYYYLMEGKFKASTPQEVVDTGVLGTLDAPAYISENGECVGTGCTYHSPDRSDAHLPAHLIWTAPRKLHLTLGDQSWDIHGGQYTISDADLLEGTWATTATIMSGGLYLSPPQPLARVSRSTKTAANFPTLKLAPNAVIYDLTILNYVGAPQPASRDSFLASDPRTGALVGFYVDPAYGGGLADPVITSKEFLSGPQTVRGYFTDGGTVIGEAVRLRLRAGDAPL